MSKYHYTECGLQNVFIEGLTPVEDAEGDLCIEITAVNALHMAIAEGIVRQIGSISAAELRFLRTEMGYTQAELARMVHANKQTVGRWERGEYEIDSNAETIIRMLAIEKLLIEFDASIEQLSASSVPTAETNPINIKAENDQYQLAA